MSGRFESLRRRLEARILDGPGRSTPALRRAAADGRGLPIQLGSYTDQVAVAAHEVTDDEVRALRVWGASEDEIFELTVAAALGAARRRLDAALAALASPAVDEG